MIDGAKAFFRNHQAQATPLSEAENWGVKSQTYLDEAHFWRLNGRGCRTAGLLLTCSVFSRCCKAARGRKRTKGMMMIVIMIVIITMMSIIKRKMIGNQEGDLEKKKN